MGVALARPDLVRSLILMDTSAWSFLPPDKDLRAIVHGFIDSFDPAGGMPTTLRWVAPRTAHRGAHAGRWRKEKDAIFTGMDAYAVKGLGSALMGDDAERPAPCGPALLDHLPDHGHRR